MIPEEIIVDLYSKFYDYSETLSLSENEKHIEITHYPLREKFSEVVADNFRGIIKEQDETDELNFKYNLISFNKTKEVLSINDFQLKSLIKQGALKVDNNIAIIKEYSLLSLDSLINLLKRSYVHNDPKIIFTENKIYRLVDKLIISNETGYHPQGIRKMIESKRVNYFRFTYRITRYALEDFQHLKKK